MNENYLFDSGKIVLVHRIPKEQGGSAVLLPWFLSQPTSHYYFIADLQRILEKQVT